MRTRREVGFADWEKSGGRPSGGTGVGRPQGSATGGEREPKSSGTAGLQQKLDVLQWFDDVTMTDQANPIFRSRTGFSVSPEDQQCCPA
jgi:hypothetical protein